MEDFKSGELFFVVVTCGASLLSTPASQHSLLEDQPLSRRERGKKTQQQSEKLQPSRAAEELVSGGRMRRPPNAHEVQRGVAEHRSSPQHSPEVHIIGEICSGVGFGQGVSCKWRIDHGKFWGILEGGAEGHTQTAYAREGGSASWNHPVDIHYQTTSIQGWPKIMVQIQQLDSYGRVGVIAHGFAHIPCSPGAHHLVIPCWRAVGTQEEELRGTS
jgi:hypothetical protein